MRSQLDVRLGSQEPTILHLPPDVVSLAAAEEAIELADAYGVADGHPLAESQKITLRAAGGERVDGTWAATRVGDFGPRQGTGKNDKIAAWELAHLVLFGTELIIHTAHEFPTANESFLRLVAVFENWDDLRRRVARIRYANGEQGIEFRTGQRLKYRARTGGSGRGFAKAGLLIYDEAQHLASEHVAASGPSKFANPNSQTWYAGSGGLATSVMAWRIRRDALSGDLCHDGVRAYRMSGGRLAYTEMTAEDVELVGGHVVSKVPDDLLDRDVWYRTIPGLGRWVTEEGAEALVDELGALFGREILCIWEPEPLTSGNIIDPVIWASLADPPDEAGGHPGSSIEFQHAWALSVSPDRKWACIGIAGRRSDGLIHVEWKHHDPGTAWVVPTVKTLFAKRKIPLRIATASAEASLIDDLVEAGVEVYEVPTGEVARATGEFIDHVNNRGLRHLGQRSLDRCLQHAVLKTTEAGASVWAERSSEIEITPLKAVTVALGGVTEQKDRSAVNNVW